MQQEASLSFLVESTVETVSVLNLVWWPKCGIGALYQPEDRVRSLSQLKLHMETLSQIKTWKEF